MGQKVMLDLDVVTQADFQRLAQHVDAACTNVADHERELALLRVSVQNIQQWIAERAIEKHAAQKYAPPPPAPAEEADDTPPTNGPAVARACPRGTTKVWLGLTTRQAEVLRIILGSIGGDHWSRAHTIDPAYAALVSVQGPMGEIPGLGENPGLMWDYWSGHYAPDALVEARDA